MSILASYIFITVTSLWTRWRLKSLASRLFTQPFIQAQIKENIKASRHWLLWEEFTGDRRIPTQRARNADLFLFDDVIMYIKVGQMSTTPIKQPKIPGGKLATVIRKHGMCERRPSLQINQDLFDSIWAVN